MVELLICLKITSLKHEDVFRICNICICRGYLQHFLGLFSSLFVYHGLIWQLYNILESNFAFCFLSNVGCLKILTLFHLDPQFLFCSLPILHELKVVIFISPLFKSKLIKGFFPQTYAVNFSKLGLCFILFLCSRQSKAISSTLKLFYFKKLL